MQCISCGRRVQDDATFCPYCGGAVRAVQYAPPRKSHTSRNIGIAFLVVLILLLLILLIARGVPGSPSIAYPTVTVGGSATTTGFGTVPYRVGLTSSSTGQTYWTLVQNGQYSVSVPNGVSYSITITYTEGLGTSVLGSCNAGQLNVNIQASNYYYNVQC